MTLNAGRWASVAKDNVVKISSTAAQQATELTKNVNEKVKEGGLFSSFSSAGTKAWSSVNSYISSEQISSLTNSASTMFGRGGYNSVPGETGYNSAANNSTNLFSDDSNDGQRSGNSPNQRQQNNNNDNKKEDDWNWDSNWETSSSKNKSQNNTSTAKNTSVGVTKSKTKDLMNFDDDQWETIEPSKSK